MAGKLAIWHLAATLNLNCFHFGNNSVPAGLAGLIFRFGQTARSVPAPARVMDRGELRFLARDAANF
jgi:hypothetical protein